MTSHLGVMILFAILVSVVFGALMRDEPREQWRFAARLCAGLVVGAYLAGWVMWIGFR
jgi:hypothetical protein